MRHATPGHRVIRFALFTLALAVSIWATPVAAGGVPPICQSVFDQETGRWVENGMVTASVVALDQPIWSNRLGAGIPSGMIFALERDVCEIGEDGGCKPNASLELPLSAAGNVMLKPYKRPRPITLRLNRGQCLQIHFKNLLAETANGSKNPGDPPQSGLVKSNAIDAQPATRRAGVHVQGMQWVRWLAAETRPDCPDGMQSAACSDGSWVGTNPRSVIDPGTEMTYTVYAEHEGPFVLSSTADNYTGGNGDGGTLPLGLFGAVHVQPGGAEYYRSQVTAKDLDQASPGQSDLGQPFIDYTALYRVVEDGQITPGVRTTDAGCFKNGTCRVGPVLSMLCTHKAAQDGFCTYQGFDGNNPASGPVIELVHADLTGVITGPGAGRFEGERQEPQILDGDTRAILGFDAEDGTLASSYALPDRLQPYREITVIYQDSFLTQQAFQTLYNADPMKGALIPGGDFFAFNYGTAGIGSEIIANRLHLGPMHDCTACKYEEFFLSSWAVGDPAMVVDKAADSSCKLTSERPPKGQTFALLGKDTFYVCDPGAEGATMALYPDDPSNVYHSYLSDHTKFRVVHGAADLHHLHHQHAHQWLHTPDTSNGDYTDSQSIGPGSAFTMEMVYNGSGNVNQTVGDSIFHCHFYPHFAAGMWALWRVHDVYEKGTELTPCESYPHCPPAKNSRALPDGEIARGTPIPAVVPMPTIPMPPMPSEVRLAQVMLGNSTKPETVVEVCKDDFKTCVNATEREGTPTSENFRNPGFPFFIPSIAGQRAVHPPLDFAYVCNSQAGKNAGKSCVLHFELPGVKTPPIPDDSCQKLCGKDNWTALDGGLPRGLVLGGGVVSKPSLNATDYSKVMESVHWLPYPEEGTLVERIAMRANAQRLNPSFSPTGEDQVVNGYDPGNPGSPNFRKADFIYNGRPPVPGAPFADPCLQYSLDGGPLEPLITRQYLAADVQVDATFNKEGWHFPQQRMITLWGDVQSTLTGERPPEPFFFRSNSRECIDYTLANLVPNLYELDDFQVRTPTDILGQHIHLVKFDVTSSDGAANGFNYEDGTFAPNEVTERIAAINKGAGKQVLKARYLPFFGPGPEGQWVGSQATIQRWWSDPLLNMTYRSPDPAKNPGVDRTLRTVFTHDHFSPSTHQQAGLYAGLVVEPYGSDWFCNDNALFCKDVPEDQPFGGARVGNLERDGKPFGKPGPGRPVKPWDYGGSLNGTPPAVPVNDGGPTSWQSVIESHATCQHFPGNSRKRCVAKSKSGPTMLIGWCEDDSDCAGYREFLFEFQDSTLTYQAFDPDVIRSHRVQLLENIQAKYGTTGTGWCSNAPNKGCTAATASKKADTSGCGDPDAVCYAYGFCSTPTDNADASRIDTPCRLKTAQLAEDTQFCTPPKLGLPVGPGEATCNLVEGVPSFNLNNCVVGTNANTCFVSQASCQTTADCEFIGGWAAASAISNTNQPELITLRNATFNFTMNYRSEPLFPRLDSAKLDSSGGLPPLPGKAGDTAFAFTSIPREKSLLDALAQDNAPPYPPLTGGVGEDDPFTPLLRAYPGDDVQIRILVGAHINPHNFTFQGLNWLMEPSFVSSGWRNSQVMGISEHFEVLTQVPSSVDEEKRQADYLYLPTAAALSQASGSWGLLRAYGDPQFKENFLRPLPQNPAPAARATTGPVCSGGKDEPLVTYEVVATTVRGAFGDDNGLVYTPTAPPSPPPPQNQTGAWDPSALIYLEKSDCVSGFPNDCKAKGKPRPLVLRAAAGSCIRVTLYNALPKHENCPAEASDNNDFNYRGSRSPTLLHPPGEKFIEQGVRGQSCTSTQVGLHPQLVAFNTTESNGFNVGRNPTQTVGPKGKVTYTWYAGHIDPEDGTKIPIEFGPANLVAADALNQWQHGLYAGLVIEPKGATWPEGATGPSALVKTPTGEFKEHVVFTADGLGLFNTQQFPSKTFLTLDQAVSLNALNYQAPVFDAGLGSDVYRGCPNILGDQSCVLSAGDTQQTGVQPPTNPAVFEACAGQQVRFHFLHPGGINTNNTMEIFGHVWSEAPYESVPGPPGKNGCVAPTMHTNLYASSVMGDDNFCSGLAQGVAREESLTLNEWQGSHMGHGPQNHMTFLLESAGGVSKAPGDYLIRSYPAMHFRLGMWGIFRVKECSAR